MSRREKEIEKLVDDFMNNDKTRNQFVEAINTYFQKELEPLKDIDKIVESINMNLGSHYNLYKCEFGELANPEIDICRKELKAVLSWVEALKKLVEE